MSFFDQGNTMSINAGETTSLSSGRSLLFRPHSTSAVVEGLKNNKKKVAGSLATVIFVVAMSATFIGMQHSSQSVYPAEPAKAHQVVLPSKAEDHYVDDEPKAMELNARNDEAPSPTKNQLGPTPERTFLARTIRTSTPANQKPVSLSDNQQFQDTPGKSDGGQKLTAKNDSEKVPLVSNMKDNGDDSPPSVQTRLAQHNLMIQEHAVPPQPPKREKVRELPKDASSKHAKSVINEMHLRNQTYWRYDCLDGRIIVGYKSVLTFVYNKTIYEFVGYGDTIKVAETAAAEKAVHRLWNIDYETRPELSEKDRQLCPKTPTVNDMPAYDSTNEEIELALAELYSKLKTNSFIQNPRRLTKKDLPKDPLKIDPKSLIYQMQLESFQFHKLKCLNGRSLVGFKCILTFVYNETLHEYEGYGKHWTVAGKEAARLACLDIWDLRYDPYETNMSEKEREFCPTTPALN